MSNPKVGQKIRIVAGHQGDPVNLKYHYFKLGAVVEVTRANSDGGVDARGTTYNLGRPPRENHTQILQRMHYELLVDFTKPLTTEEGTPVELVTSTARDPKFPIIGYEGTALTTSKWSAEGVHSSGAARRNLINKKPIVKPLFIVLKKDGSVSVSTDSLATALMLGGSEVVGSVKVEVKEGEFVAA